MSLVRYDPPEIAPPSAVYAHAVAVPAGYRWILLSGQIGMAPDGTIPPGTEAQLEIIWTNIEACLTAQGMGLGDLVRVQTYLIDAADRPLTGLVRSRRLPPGLRLASTLLVVARLGEPEWRVEIEATAAAAA